MTSSGRTREVQGVKVPQASADVTWDAVGSWVLHTMHPRKTNYKKSHFWLVASIFSIEVWHLSIITFLQPFSSVMTHKHVFCFVFKIQSHFAFMLWLPAANLSPDISFSHQASAALITSADQLWSKRWRLMGLKHPGVFTDMEDWNFQN